MRVAFFVVLLNPKEKVKHLKCPKNGVHYMCSYGLISIIYRLSNVYVSCTYRISIVIDSGLIKELRKKKERRDGG